jgi:hypothetical protein
MPDWQITALLIVWAVGAVFAFLYARDKSYDLGLAVMTAVFWPTVMPFLAAMYGDL